MKEIETDEVPEALSLAAAGTLERWSLTEGPLCAGLIRSHPVIKDGVGFTDKVIAVAKDRSWVGAPRGLFKLGASRRWWPLSEAVTSPDWMAALGEILEREELPGEVRRAAAELEVEAKSMSWPKRRLLAKEIRRRLEHHKKQGLADAFRVLEADVKDKHDCMAVVERLELLIGKRPMHALAGDLNSWKILASGWVPAEDDPLVAAHQAAGAHRAGAITGADILNSMAELKVEAEADIFKLARELRPRAGEAGVKTGVVVVSKIGGVESAATARRPTPHSRT